MWEKVAKCIKYASSHHENEKRIRYEIQDWKNNRSQSALSSVKDLHFLAHGGVMVNMAR